ERRLAKAAAALQDLPARKQGKRQLFHAELVAEAEAIVARAGVAGLLRYTAQAVLTTRPKRAYAGRPARQETDVSFVTEVQREEVGTVQGVYAGQAGRKTARPSAELLLRVMQTISLSVIEVNGQTHALLSPLTEVQKRLLELWDLPADLYENVTRGFPKPPSNR